MQDTKQTQRNNPPSKCVWKVGVIRVGKGSREKAPEGGGVSGNAEIQSLEFLVADSMSRPHCSLFSYEKKEHAAKTNSFTNSPFLKKVSQDTFCSAR